MQQLAATVTRRETGESLWFGGGLVTLLVTSAQSDGALLMIEHAAGRGKTTPLHCHPDNDEVGYVLEGEILFHLDGKEHRVGAGEGIWIPRGTPHAMLVVSEVARSIWVSTPGRITEEFFRQGGEPAPRRELPNSTNVDVERLLAAGQRTGAMQVYGPPPFQVAGAA